MGIFLRNKIENVFLKAAGTQKLISILKELFDFYHSSSLSSASDETFSLDSGTFSSTSLDSGAVSSAPTADFSSAASSGLIMFESFDSWVADVSWK